MWPLSDECLNNYKIKILKLAILTLKRHKRWDYFIQVGIMCMQIAVVFLWRVWNLFLDNFSFFVFFTVRQTMLTICSNVDHSTWPFNVPITVIGVTKFHAVILPPSGWQKWRSVTGPATLDANLKCQRHSERCPHPLRVLLPWCPSVAVFPEQGRRMWDILQRIYLFLFKLENKVQ